MKKLLVFIMCFLSASVLFAQDMKLEDILAKNFKASGQDKLAKITTIRVTMKMAEGGMEALITMSQKYPNSMRMETEFQGTKIIYAVDGQNGWMINPASGSLEPQDMPAEVLNDYIDNTGTFLNWKNPFFNWKEKGNKIELVGKEDMNGTPVYNIKITFADNQVYNYFVDAAKFLVLKEKDTETMQGQEVTEEDIYSDFREIDGVLIAFKVEVSLNGQSGQSVTVDKCEFNIPLDDALFTKPVPK